MRILIQAAVAGIILATISACGSLTGGKGRCEKYTEEAFGRFQMATFEEAAKSIKKAIKCNPNKSQNYALQAAIHEALGDSATALQAHANVIKYDSCYQANYYYYASYLFRLNRYDEAEKIIEGFDKAPQTRGYNPKKDAANKTVEGKIDRLRRAIAMAREESVIIAQLEIQNMGPSINSKAHEYWPGMPIDGNTFVYTRLVRSQEDFYFSYKANDSQWSQSVPAPGRVNTPENEGTSSVYIGPERQRLYFTVCNQGGYGSCDLFYSDLTDGKWGSRKNMGPNINTSAWDAQPSISGDGNTLVFASSRAGGQGGKDLWIAHKINGKWSIPENLGVEINTEGDEEAPFLHYDGKTLYFSSRGHEGYGEHDFFMVRKDDNGQWSLPVNLGRGINTERDDVGFYVDARAEKAYFASTRSGGFGGMDIYKMNLPEKYKPEPVNYLLGMVIDKETKEAIAAHVQLVDLKSNKIIFEDSVDEFLIPIIPGNNYALHSSKEGYLFDSRNFQPEKSTSEKPFEIVAELEKIKKNQVVRLNNIFFDIDKYLLKHESFVELDVVVKILIDNPKMKIEISGHTDNTGSAEHNQELSENRAKSVERYLVEQGISSQRLISKGYGPSKPMASNETDEGRAFNRRIEMKVLEIE